MPDRFVWIRFNGVNRPQRWPEDGLGDFAHYQNKDGIQGKATPIAGRVVADYVIKREHLKLSIDELAKLYPVHKVESEVLPSAGALSFWG